MSFHRALLATDKLQDFKQWLERNDIPMRPGKGYYQVLQVFTPDSGWQVVFRKGYPTEHFTINKRLELLVRAFLKDSRAVKE